MRRIEVFCLIIVVVLFAYVSNEDYKDATAQTICTKVVAK